MKKNYTMVFATVTALIALCAFWGCSSSDDDDGPSLPQAEEASLGNVQITVADGVQVYKADGTTPYTFTPGPAKQVTTYNHVSGSYAAAVAALSSIDANGKLTLKLPVVTDWTGFDSNGFQDDGLAADPFDVKTVEIRTLVFSVSSDNFELDNINTTNGDTLRYIYADKDARISGVEDDGDTVDLILKQGWNAVIKIRGKNGTGSGGALVTGKHGSGYRWVASDDD
ncbi:MAG: hypothetical protein LBK13_13745 [Spirochaetales bacterium]|jgi:hypothetical protein|nr:hypothetical protein [Spirochaetales bacterium]